MSYNIPGPCLPRLTQDCHGRLVEASQEDEVFYVPQLGADFRQVDHGTWGVWKTGNLKISIQGAS